MTLLFRWLGRVSGLVVALLFVAFWVHAPPHYPALETRMLVQLALLITAVAAMLLGWWRERIGGVVSLLALVGFLVLEATAIRKVPTMPAVYAMMLPGLLLLAAARQARAGREGSPAQGMKES